MTISHIDNKSNWVSMIYMNGRTFIEEKIFTLDDSSFY